MVRIRRRGLAPPGYTARPARRRAGAVGRAAGRGFLAGRVVSRCDPRTGLGCWEDREVVLVSAVLEPAPAPAGAPPRRGGREPAVPMGAAVDRADGWERSAPGLG